MPPGQLSGPSSSPSTRSTTPAPSTSQSQSQQQQSARNAAEQAAAQFTSAMTAAIAAQAGSSGQPGMPSAADFSLMLSLGLGLNPADASQLANLDLQKLAMYLVSMNV